VCRKLARAHLLHWDDKFASEIRVDYSEGSAVCNTKSIIMDEAGSNKLPWRQIALRESPSPCCEHPTGKATFPRSVTGLTSRCSTSGGLGSNVSLTMARPLKRGSASRWQGPRSPQGLCYGYIRAPVAASFLCVLSSFPAPSVARRPEHYVTSPKLAIIFQYCIFLSGIPNCDYHSKYVALLPIGPIVGHAPIACRAVSWSSLWSLLWAHKLTMVR
jgi:hypothetical protein